MPEDDQWGLGVAIAAAPAARPPPIDFPPAGGEEIWLRASSTAGTDGPAGRRLHGLVIDSTEAIHAQAEHALMETELRLAQKLEAVGQLAAGIAHEINTPVQFVGDTVRFLREAFERPDASCSAAYGAPLDRAAAAGPVAPSCWSASRAAEDVADFAYLHEGVPPTFERARDGLERVASIVRRHARVRAPADDASSSRSTSTTRCADTLIVARNEYKYVADVEHRASATLPSGAVQRRRHEPGLPEPDRQRRARDRGRRRRSGERGTIAIAHRHERRRT